MARIDSPPAPSTVSGTTALLARCLRVGGATQPKAELRLTKGGGLLHVQVSEVIARRLGHHLYEEIQLTGNATWRTDTWEIVDFQVETVAEFKRIAPSIAFRELAEVAGDALKDSDVWTLAIRGSDEE